MPDAPTSAPSNDPHAIVHRYVVAGWDFVCDVDNEPWPCAFVRSARALIKQVNGGS